MSKVKTPKDVKAKDLAEGKMVLGRDNSTWYYVHQDGKGKKSFKKFDAAKGLPKDKKNNNAGANLFSFTPSTNLMDTTDDNDASFPAKDYNPFASSAAAAASIHPPVVLNASASAGSFAGSFAFPPITGPGTGFKF